MYFRKRRFEYEFKKDKINYINILYTTFVFLS